MLTESNDTMPAHPTHLVAQPHGQLHLQLGSLRLEEDRLQLLEHIHEFGSLSKAAVACGVSYRTAWSWVDSLNHLAGETLVESKPGGHSGGVSVLTTRGRGLLDQWHLWKSMHDSWLERLMGVTTLDWETERPSTMEVPSSAGVPVPSGFSSQNALRMRVGTAECEGLVAWVRGTCPGGQPLLAKLSRRSLVEAGIVPGAEVVAVFNENCVQVGAVGSCAAFADVNRWRGRVISCSSESGPAEVVLDCGEGVRITSIVDQGVLRRLQPVAERMLDVWCEASSVMLVRVSNP